ncbi:MAG: cytochrome c oxidase assembly protein [Alphaproteobacteria bacterium]|nr:cytochrome c oxidase assembly protein [Alphaproteobacteria bacterium]
MSEPGSKTRANRRVAVAMAAVVVGMVGMAYAAVPLYRIFCQVTGFGGTPSLAESAPAETGKRTITVRFDANVMGGPNALAWHFSGPAPVKVKTGEETLIFYKASNSGPAATTGTATYNVQPEKAAPYFDKVACFCFSEQTLSPGESLDLPVSFFVDPAIEKDPRMSDVTTITLSYSFHRAADQPKTAQAAKQN